MTKFGIFRDDFRLDFLNHGFGGFWPGRVFGDIGVDRLLAANPRSSQALAFIF